MKALRPVRASRLALLFLVCTAVGLFFAHRLFLIRRELDHHPISWTNAIRWSLGSWYLWGATACLVIWLARRFPIERDRWRSRVVVHAVASCLTAVFHLALCSVWYWLSEAPFDDPRSFWQMYEVQLLISFHWDVLIYAGVLAATHAYDFHHRSRERDLKSAHLESQLAQAQLAALKMQLHPHFLFNSLNAVASLVHDDPSAAERVIVKLSALLRFAMENANVLEVPLSDELAFARMYLDIEHIRFGNRLRVQWNVEPKTLSEMVPSLILQPLVENAVRHGAAPQSSPCVITVEASTRSDTLRLEVRDTGGGATRNASAPDRLHVGRHVGHHLGLANTRARLQKMYGSAARLDLIRPRDGGWIARIEMPLQTFATARAAGALAHG